MEKKEVLTEERVVEEEEEDVMEIPRWLENIPRAHLKKLHKWLSRRAYAVHILQRAARYVEGYLDDYSVQAEVERHGINPRLIVEVKMDKEVPPEIQTIVFKHPYELTEIFDWLNERKWLERRKKAAKEKIFRWREPKDIYMPYEPGKDKE